MSKGDRGSRGVRSEPEGQRLRPREGRDLPEDTQPAVSKPPSSSRPPVPCCLFTKLPSRQAGPSAGLHRGATLLRAGCAGCTGHAPSREPLAPSSPRPALTAAVPRQRLLQGREPCPDYLRTPVKAELCVQGRASSPPELRCPRSLAHRAPGRVEESGPGTAGLGPGQNPQGRKPTAQGFWAEPQ